MEEAIIDKIKKTKLINAGDSILVGFSGGADSVCLLHGLYKLSKPLSLTIYAAHLNHQLRGMDSNEDAAFALNFAKERQIVCVIKSVDVTTYAEKHGMSLETAGRECRYRFFEEVADKIKADKIALGHHLNDQAETLLMNLIRGAGLDGLAGMPTSRGKIIRPLMKCSRREVETFCADHALNYREDATNKETDFFRNKVRIQLIPQLQSFQPTVLESMAKTVELLEQDKAYFEEVVFQEFQTLVLQQDDDHVEMERKKLENCSPAILSRILRKAYYTIQKSNHTMEFHPIKRIMQGLRDGKIDKTYQLPGKISVVLGKESVCFAKESYGLSRLDPFQKYGERKSIPLKIPGVTNLPWENGNILCEVINSQKPPKISNNPLCQVFDRHRLPSNLVVRNRRDGDWIRPLGMEGSKKLKDFFIDNKIPVEERDRIFLLAHDQEILWIIGYRMSEEVKVSKKTRKVVRMHYRPNKEKESFE